VTEDRPVQEAAPGQCGPLLAGDEGVRWIWSGPEAGIPADAPLPMLLLTAAKAMGAFYGGTVADAGVRISPAGLGVLRVLLAADGLKSSEVAARGMSSPGTLTSVVDGLVREGYVERRGDAADRRVVRLHVTEKGRRTSEHYTTSAGPRWREAFGFVDPADEPVIRAFFVELIQRLSELIKPAAKGGKDDPAAKGGNDHRERGR
jgi:MarR family transcriptional regulator, organic hydroperoxide resistance regulator